MVVVVELLVDDRQVVLVHVDSPNIVYNMSEDNENFDKTNQQLMNKMHMVHSLAKMDQYQAENIICTMDTNDSMNLPIYENNHI
jgi:TATA-box binding protein (TBP) (component of TFIID and TFIIIB)